MNTAIKTISFGIITFLVSSSIALATTGYYTNSNGVKVQSPVSSFTVPSGASALCKDGTYSFSKHHRGTCSGHKGVKRWL
jgi:hypothetical protein